METLRFNNTFQHLHITYICVGIVHAYIHKNCVLQSNVNCTFIHMYEYILHLVSIISKSMEDSWITSFGYIHLQYYGW